MKTTFCLHVLSVFSLTAYLHAEEPTVSYIFPAGGQVGTEVQFKVGGHYLHGTADFVMTGPGVAAAPKIAETKTLWFEGPVISQPASQRKEDYPRDHLGSVKLAADATPGIRHWRVSTSQGVTPAMRFMVGTLPELVEEEREGVPSAIPVSAPVTVNGRIFPREDVDLWSVNLKGQEWLTCRVDAQSVGSPLIARLEVTGPDGTRVAEAVGEAGRDPELRFQAPVAGRYRVRIHDAGYEGLQNFVYRLTLSTGLWVDGVYPLGGKRGATIQLHRFGQMTGDAPVPLPIPADAPEWMALPTSLTGHRAAPLWIQTGDAPDLTEGGAVTAWPAVLNGRIMKAGEADTWPVSLIKDDAIQISVIASELGSPLRPVIAILDETGKPAAEAKALTGPVSLSFKAPKDGGYSLRVQDRFATRGGPEFAYRMRIEKVTPAPDFQLTLSTDAVSVFRALENVPEDQMTHHPVYKTERLTLEAKISGGFKEDIELVAEGLPEGVTLETNKFPRGRPKLDLKFAAGPKAKIGVYPILLKGKAPGLERIASVPTIAGEPARDKLMVGVALPAPFMFAADYLMDYAPRGSIYDRHFRLYRNGFEGPITVRLADRQIRHLQGNQGPEFVLSGKEAKFTYPVKLAPFLELQRTSRTTVMLSGEVTDFDGSRHVVSFSSQEQNDQVIISAVPGLLALELEKPSLSLGAGESASLAVRIRRDPALAEAAVRIFLDSTRPLGGVSAEPVELKAGETQGVLTLRGGQAMGPPSMPIRVLAESVSPAKWHQTEAFLKVSER